jgi:hypothetical protein
MGQPLIHNGSILNVCGLVWIAQKPQYVLLEPRYHVGASPENAHPVWVGAPDNSPAALSRSVLSRWWGQQRAWRFWYEVGPPWATGSTWSHSSP